MLNKPRHVSVCVCTFKRPHCLARLLRELGNQETETLFTFSIVVIDNDLMQSAKAVVLQFAAVSPIDVIYHVETQQGICKARNKAIEYSIGDFFAFIDDDEFPKNDWLVHLFRTCENERVDGALGPVIRHFDELPPKWLIKSNFYVRPSHPTGFVIDWQEGRTGNVLLKRRVIQAGETPFNPEFHRGGDTDFFRRMIGRGHVFVWCDEAVVYEVVPPIRWTRTFMLKRALLRGAISLKDRPGRLRSISKSILAVPAYTVALPFTLALGHHLFVDLLARLFYHLGKLLASIGIEPVSNPFATD